MNYSHLLCDITSIDDKINLSDEIFIENVVRDSIDGLDIKIIKYDFYKFKPQGLTMFFSFDKGHISYHSYDEYRSVMVDVLCDFDKSDIIRDRLEKKIIGHYDINYVIRTSN